MNAQKKRNVKRIRPPRKSKTLALRKSEMHYFIQISDQSLELVKVAINSMFVLNGAAAISLINIDIFKFSYPITVFSMGALASIVFSILMSLAILPVKLTSNDLRYKILKYAMKVLAVVYWIIRIVLIYLPIGIFGYGIKITLRYVFI